jgi:predicted HD superfamily hydrolase involved in NAD metabolism
MQEYESILRGNLTESRYDHVCAVSTCAGELADLHGLDRGKAELAGLLHDYARDLPADDLLRIGRARKLITCKIEEQLPVLLHGPVGAIRIEDELGINDAQVLEAVALHTLAGPAMGKLAQVIYIADLIAEGRDFSAIGYLRNTARENLNEALLECIASTIGYCLERRWIIHPQTIEAWNFYSYGNREEGI